MSTLCSGFNVMIVLKNKKALFFEFYLEDEESVRLSDKKGLFSSVSSTDDIIEEIKQGFESYYDDCSFLEMFEESDSYSSFEDLIFLLEKHEFEEIESIVLLTDTDSAYGPRKYEWIKYNLSPYGIEKGRTGNANLYEDDEDDEELPSVIDYLTSDVVSGAILINGGEFDFDEDYNEEEDNEEEDKDEDDTPEIPFGITLQEFEKNFAFSKSEYGKRYFIDSYIGQEAICVIPEYVEHHSITVISLGTNPNLQDVIIPQNVIISPNAFDGYSKFIDENGFVIVSGRLFLYKGNSSEIEIPYGVTSVERDCFKENCDITEVVIPDGVESIKESAFENCEKLSRVELPDTLKTIEYCAFSHTEIEELVLPDSIETIGDNAFEECENLTLIEFSKKLKSIGSFAFSNTGIEEVVLPASLETVGEYAFSDCYYLKNVEIYPHTVLGDAVFSSFQNENAEFISRNDGLVVFNGVMFAIDYSKHKQYLNLSPNVDTIRIPADVSRIAGDNCFGDGVLDEFSFSDNLKYLNNDDFGLWGIECLKILDHITGETIFETDMFAYHSRQENLSNVQRFNLFCQVFNQKGVDGILKEFSKYNKAKSTK